MKLLFIGSGSAFSVNSNNYHSNMLLLSPTGEKLLIDCGSDARLSLNEQGYTFNDIEHVYISHLHGDHAGGLEWLGFTRKFDPTCDKPALYISELLVDDLWNKVLSGGMGSLQGEIATLSSYYNVKPIKSNGGFNWQKTSFNIVQTIHTMDGFKISPSFGLLFKVSGKTIFITTDTQFAPAQIIDFYKMADIIFHDCETIKSRSGVHANYLDLVGLDKSIKSKMWLYHYNSENTYDAKADGFRGFVQKGQIFDFEEDSTL